MEFDTNDVARNARNTRHTVIEFQFADPAENGNINNV